MVIGINIQGLAYYSPDILFGDIVKQSQPSLTPCTIDAKGNPHAAATLPAPVLGPDGWPTALPNYPPNSGVMFNVFGGEGARPEFPAGNYTLNLRGLGTLIVYQTVGKPQMFVGTGAPLTVAVPIQSVGSGITFIITATDPRNPLRFSLTTPQAAGIWHQPFLDALAPFAILRCMCPLATNNSPIKSWSDAPQLSQRSYAGPNGVPLETLIDLANTTGKMLWLCGPHAGTASYYQDRYALIYANLDTSLSFVDEFSNENWNYAAAFAQGYDFVNEYANAYQPKGISAPEAWADLSLTMWNIGRQVFGAQASRIIRVYGTQTGPGGAWQLGKGLNWILAHSDPADANKGVDVVSCAPYFGPSSANIATYCAATTTAQILADYQAAIPGAISRLTAYLAVRDSYTLRFGRTVPFWAYEGGPGMTDQSGASSPYFAAYCATQTDPGIGAVVTNYVQALAAAGVDAICFFDLAGMVSGWGNWGAIEYYGSPQTPKYDALAAACAATPAAS
jgi:hypothetical protein